MVGNDAGKELLNFLSLNESTVCNTWFKKKNIYKHTWQNPKSKKWHCIDFAIVREMDRRRCLDAHVVRGAECNTDHQMLRIKLRMSGKQYHHKQQKNSSTRFDVAKLLGPSEDENGVNTPRGHFQELLIQKQRKSGKRMDQWKRSGQHYDQH